MNNFNEQKALRVIKFIELLKHAEGKWYGKPFTLLEWQRQVISKVYGTLRPDQLRQYEYLYLEIPKKNGKTALAAALGIYHTFADGEMNGEVYGCAAEKNQASIAFDVAVEMIEQCPALKKRTQLVISKKLLKDKKSGTTYKVLSAEAYSKHGFKPSAVIFDELHAQPHRDLWDTMTFGAGDTREQPIWLVITTAGDDPDRNSIGWEIHEKAQKIISGELIDPRWHCVVYGAEEGDDIYDEKIWYKVNPSLGTVIDINKVRNAAIGAKQSSAEEKLFKWLRLNIWIDNKSQSWINQTVWDANNLEGFDKTQLAGMKCYGGLDLSSTTDLSALTLGFPPQMGLDHWFLIMFAWIPLDNMKKRVKFDHVPYDKWVNEGWLTATPGNCIDYDFIENKILEVYKLYDVITIGTDPWNSRALTQRCAKQGVDFIEVPQTMAGMSPAMKHTESLLKKQQLKHEKNPVARWCFGNVAVAVDGNENIKPMKNKSKDRIDITVSMINMVAIAMRTEVDSIYEGKGLTII